MFNKRQFISVKGKSAYLPREKDQEYIDREIGALITWAVNVNSSGVKACSGCRWALDRVVPPVEFAPTAKNMCKYICDYVIILITTYSNNELKLEIH